MIEGHGHVRPECHLDFHRSLRGEQDAAAVAWIAEIHALVIDAIEIAKTEDLKSTGIGEHRSVPAHEPMQSACGLHNRLARLQMQVVGVRQHHLGTGGCQLVRADPLHGGEGPHRHEPRRIDNPVRG